MQAFFVDRERNRQMFGINKDVAYACVSRRRPRFKFDYNTFGGLPNVTPSKTNMELLEIPPWKRRNIYKPPILGDSILVLGGVPVTLKP